MDQVSDFIIDDQQFMIYPSINYEINIEYTSVTLLMAKDMIVEDNIKWRTKIAL